MTPAVAREVSGAGLILPQLVQTQIINLIIHSLQLLQILPNPRVCWWEDFTGLGLFSTYMYPLQSKLKYYVIEGEMGSANPITKITK